MTFLASLPPCGPAREAYVAAALARLDPPTWVRVTCGPAVLEVSADYLTIDAERVPLSATNAQRAVDLLGAVLPSVCIVEAIEAAATIVPLPTRPPDGAKQLSAEWIAWCEERTPAVTGLVAGHRKDVVLADAPAGRVAIFGARWPNGTRLQPLNASHEAGYHDYSHGVRAVRDACTVDGEPARVSDLLRTGVLGSLAAVRYPTEAPQVQGPRALRRGMVGEDVRVLQRLLSAAGFATKADGVFGAMTEAAVRTFQGDAGIGQDGIAGARTLGALRAFADTDERIPFVQAKNYRAGRLRPIRAVVLHTAETAEVPDAAERLAAWAAGPDAPMASWHYAVDADSVVQCVREEDTAFAAPGLNADGLQIEMSGRAGQGRDGWADAYSRAVLARTAGLVADLCRRHGLPVAFVGAAGLLRGEKGITTHAEVTAAYRQSTHTDPGADFPMVAFLAAVRSS